MLLQKEIFPTLFIPNFFLAINRYKQILSIILSNNRIHFILKDENEKIEDMWK